MPSACVNIALRVLAKQSVGQDSHAHARTAELHKN